MRSTKLVPPIVGRDKTRHLEARVRRWLLFWESYWLLRVQQFDFLRKVSRSPIATVECYP